MYNVEDAGTCGLLWCYLTMPCSRYSCIIFSYSIFRSLFLLSFCLMFSSVFYLPSHLYWTACHLESMEHLLRIAHHFSSQCSLEIQSTHPADHPPVGPLLLKHQGSTFVQFLVVTCLPSESACAVCVVLSAMNKPMTVVPSMIGSSGQTLYTFSVWISQ